MRKIKVEIIKDKDVGLVKGTFKVLIPRVAKSMIKKGNAKFVENVEVVSKRHFNQALIFEKIEDLEKRIANTDELEKKVLELEKKVDELSKGKAEKPVKDEKPAESKNEKEVKK